MENTLPPKLKPGIIHWKFNSHNPRKKKDTKGGRSSTIGITRNLEKNRRFKFNKGKLATKKA
jgi:hypothetical protein